MNKLFLVGLLLVMISSVSAVCIDWDVGQGNNYRSNGVLPYAAGVAFNEAGDGGFDSCVNSSFVKEFFCDGEEVRSQVFECSKGCASVFYYAVYDLVSDNWVAPEHNLSYCRFTGGGNDVSSSGGGSSAVSLPSVVDVSVFDGRVNQNPLVGDGITVSCNGNSLSGFADSNGRFRALFDAGVCPLQSDVEACSSFACQVKKLIRKTSRINLLDFVLVRASDSD